MSKKEEEEELKKEKKIERTIWYVENFMMKFGPFHLELLE